ncbi:MAG: ferredoxin [Candidatus Aenigmatarchaeota archaeon]
MAKKYKIIYEWDVCIGAASCEAVAPEFWHVDKNRKAVLKGSKEIEKKVFELIIKEKDLEKNLMAAEVCPVNCIHIYDLETGKKLI